MNRESKILLISLFVASIGWPAHFIFAIMKADAITGTIMVATFFTASGSLGIIFSKLSDRYMKRKIFAQIGFVFAAIAFIGYYFATQPIELFLYAGLAGISFAASSPTISALFTEMEPDLPKGKVMSYYYVFISAGWAVGTLLGGLISQYFGDFVFISSTIMTISGLLIFSIKVHDVPPHKAEIQENFNLKSPKTNPNLQIYSVLIVILCVSVLTRHLCAQGGFALITNYLEQDLGAEPLLVSIIMAVNLITQSIIMLPIGRLVDHRKFGRKTILLLGIIGTDLTVLAWSFIHTPWILIFPQMLIGFSWPAVATASTALVTDITTRRTRSQGMAWFNVGLSVGGILGPIIAAITMAQSGLNFNLSFQILCLFPIIGIILVLVSFSENRTTHEYFLFQKK